MGFGIHELKLLKAYELCIFSEMDMMALRSPIKRSSGCNKILTNMYTKYRGIRC